MCRAVDSATPQPGPFPQVKAEPSQTQDEQGSRREMLVEKPIVSIEHFFGQWKDSNGCNVDVFSVDAFQAKLRATVVRPNGQENNLSLHKTADGWRCGAACLAAASEDQLWWSFSDGRVSIWERGSVFHLAEDEREFSLSGCQSPMEAYFNPLPFGPCNPFCFDDHHARAPLCHGIYNADALPPHAEQSTSAGQAPWKGKVWAKSRHKDGCREVQDALSSGDNDIRAAIASELKGHILASIDCPNANHVVQKCIVEMSPEAFHFIIEELMSQSGAAVHLARHRFGCRIFERLLEHGRAEQVQDMVSEVLENVGPLCTHAFGNYVLQHLFEYGTKDQQRQLVASLLPHLPKLCGDSRAAAVIAKALEYAPDEERRSLARAMLQDQDSFLQLAALRFGQAAAVAVLKLHGPEAAQARQLLANRRGGLHYSRHGRAVLKCLDSGKPEIQQQPRGFASKGGA